MITSSGSIFRASVLCSIFAFVLAGFFAVRNISSWPARISYPDDESYEGVALAEMIHLHEGIPIYAGDAKEGFDAATYGPLYYLIGEHLISPANPSYFPLRLLSAIAILGCAAGCGLLAFWLTRSRLAACLSPIVFLSYGMATDHGVAALSDSVALFLSFAGFLLAYRLRNSRAILFAAPLMVLGFYYKPQYVAGSLAVLLFLVLEKRYWQAIEFAGLLAVCGLGGFALFQWIVFAGQAFWRHLLLYQTALLAWDMVWKALFALVILLLLPLMLAVAYLREEPNRLISCYLLVAVVLGLLTYCKQAGGIHYFFESVLIVSVLVPALLAKRRMVPVCPLDLVLLLGIMLFAGQWLTRRPPQRPDIAKYDAMQSFLRERFPAHSASLGIGPGDMLQAGLETPFSGLFQLAQLSHRGIVSDRDLVNQIHAHRFAVIVVHFDISQEHDLYRLNFYTPAILRVIETDYDLDKNLEMPAPLKEGPRDRFYVYVPRPVATASASSGCELFPGHVAHGQLATMRLGEN
ncbi:MAG TPA: hypothetical protein VGR97_10730 [Candidatus Acidoferrales bacterium]|nr:hypothetical protein [Candidatus Acidoferrales bacterium]